MDWLAASQQDHSPTQTPRRRCRQWVYVSHDAGFELKCLLADDSTGDGVADDADGDDFSLDSASTQGQIAWSVQNNSQTA